MSIRPVSKKGLVVLVSLLCIFLGKSLARSTGAYQAECERDQFMCSSTRECIPSYWVCDRDDDCGDGEDEENCATGPRCDVDDFMCADGIECIPIDWRCDGDEECNDGSDEDRCDTYERSSAEWEEDEPRHHGHHHGRHHSRHAARRQH